MAEASVMEAAGADAAAANGAACASGGVSAAASASGAVSVAVVVVGGGFDAVNGAVAGVVNGSVAESSVSLVCVRSCC